MKTHYTYMLCKFTPKNALFDWLQGPMFNPRHKTQSIGGGQRPNSTKKEQQAKRMENGSIYEMLWKNQKAFKYTALTNKQHWSCLELCLVPDRQGKLARLAALLKWYRALQTILQPGRETFDKPPLNHQSFCRLSSPWAHFQPVSENVW
jgi:hypothetical protein